MEKPKLFESTKSFIWTSIFLVMLLFVRLFFEYHSYQNFISKPFYYTYAKVLTAYQKTKNGKSYSVLKLKSDEGFTFYTTTHVKDHFLGKKLRLQLFPNHDIAFQEYIGTFYVKSRIKNIENVSLGLKDELLAKVALQHHSPTLQSFYKAIFFATPIEKKLREKIAMLGVSHLVALSGFHLSILWGLIYTFLLLCYRPLQQKYFPYRHALFDVGLITMIFLGSYLWFVDFPPSLVRAYAMVLVGWIVLLLGIELLSFQFLTTILLLLTVLFPSLLVSLSFWLSVSGVFYIFLLLQYVRAWNKWLVTLFFIPFGIFILMLPVVHFIFGVTTPYQLLSVILSILFIPFYPLVILLHLLGFGGVLDTGLEWLFSLPKEASENLLPFWAIVGYIGLSLGAIWYRRLFYLLVGVAVGYGGYLFLL